jgi:hypothetical protein
VFVAGVAGGITGGLNAIKVVGTTAKIYMKVAKISVTVAESVGKQVVEDGFKGKVKAKDVVLDVAIGNIPLPLKKIKIGAATERAIATTERQLDRARRLANATTRASRGAAVDDLTKSLKSLNNKKIVNEGINEFNEGHIRGALGKGTEAAVEYMNKGDYVYIVSYYDKDGIPHGGVNYPFEDEKSAKQALAKEKRDLVAGKLAEDITEVRIDKIAKEKDK